MSITRYLSKSRGTRNLLRRIRVVLSRFGFTSKKFERILKRYHAVTCDLGCIPTFPLTAVVLERHPGLIKGLAKQGVEFAVHGYVHIDHSVLTLGEQVSHYQKAIDTFDRCKVPFAGFRAPFIRINQETLAALGHFPFIYDSSLVVVWDVIDRAKYAQKSWGEYERLLEFYRPRKAEQYLVLPRRMNGLVEIPVSIPDDESMVNRLGIKSGEISEIWRSILKRTYDCGELFTLSLHPERIYFCQDALKEVLQEAKQLKPAVWITTLREIAEWWKERETFAFEISPLDNNQYRVLANCPEKATVLVKNCKTSVPASEWANGYQSVSAKDFILESPKRPVVGVGLNSSPAAVRFLNSEGFVVERSDQPHNYGIYLGNLDSFGEYDEKPLSKKIEQSDAPLLRYWRWPNHARSAISVTGDIDSITVIDFALRVFESWRYNGR